MRTKDQIGGLFFFFVGVWVFYQALKLPLGKPSEPGPAFFPLGLSLLLAILGVWIFFSGKAKASIDWRRGFSGTVKPLVICLLTLAFILFMDPLGYLLTALLYLFSLFFFVCRFRWFIAALLAAALAGASWYLFGIILGIQLPRGPWLP